MGKKELGERMKEVKSGKKIYGLSFVLCTVAMLVCMIFSGVIGGQRTLLESDLSATYIPTLHSFFQKLLSGERLDYAWDICLGMNTTAYYAYYVGSSLVNLLFLCFSMVDPQYVVVFVILIKVGLAGFGFTYFCRKFMKKAYGFQLIFSLFYAMSSFQVYINTINIIWMDVIYILPFLLAFIVEFIDEKKWGKMVLCYIYLFTANFYMAYMVGIFSALFFLLYLCLQSEKALDLQEKIKKIFCYGVLVIFSIGASAVILLPAGLFLFQNRAGDSTSVLELKSNGLEIYNQLFLGANGDVMFSQPCIYAGIPSLLLLPFFFGSKKVEKGKKLLLGVLFGIMALSFFIPGLCLFWHAFDVPDGWPYRFSFIISLLTCVMACEYTEVNENKAAESRTEERSKLVAFGIAIGINSLFYIGMFLYQKLLTPQAISNTPVRMLLNIILLVVWGTILLQQKGKYRQIALGVAFAEVLLNGFFMFQMHGRPDKSIYDSWYYTGKQVENQLTSDSGLYRVDLGRDRQYNTDTFFGFAGIADFGTLENYEVRQALSNLGIYTSPRVQCNSGVTPFTQLILGMKYRVEDMYSMSDSPVTVYDKYLNMGFLVDQAVAENSFSDVNIFENMNHLASVMTGEKLEIFKQIPYENIMIESHGVRYGLGEDGRQYLVADLPDSTIRYITFKVADEGHKVYVAVDRGESSIWLNDPVVIDEYTQPDVFQIDEYRRLGARYAKEMDVVNGVRMLAVGMGKNLTDEYFAFDHLWVYELDEEQLDVFYRAVASHQLEITEHQNGFVKGKIQVEKEQDILFTSIPYDGGWTVTSNQGEVEIVPLLDGAMLGLSFEHPGEYEITLNYEAAGLKQGLLITVICACALTVLWILSFRKNKGSKELKAE